MTAIVLLGHGSHSTPQTAGPVYAHADRIRERNEYDEVRVAFWRQTPSIRRVLRRIESNEIVVVPVMMSTGYFVDVVFPRELRLNSDQNLTVNKMIWYTDPVGAHPSVITAVHNRISSITDNTTDQSDFGVALIGHGTNTHDESSVTTDTHANRLREQSNFAEVHSLFLDEQPRITDLDTHFSVDNLIVIPLFIADGTHTTDDIPDEFGIEFKTGPQPGKHGKTIWYSRAIGTEPLFTDIAIELADSAISTQSPTIQKHDSFTTDSTHGNNELNKANESFINWLLSTTTSESDSLGSKQSKSKPWGELTITSTGLTDQVFTIYHQDDANTNKDTLESIDTRRELRERIRYTQDNAYRPLLAAKTLRSGWIMHDLSRREVPSIIDQIYPGSIVDWYRENGDDTERKSYQSITDRYSGIYSAISSVSPDQVEALVSDCCDYCVKHPTWKTDEDPKKGSVSDGEIPCPEPCPIFIETARQTHESTTSPAASGTCNQEHSVTARVFNPPNRSASTRSHRSVDESRTKS